MTSEKKSKSDILKEKYGFNRNKKTQEEKDSEILKLNKKSEVYQKEYAYDSDNSKKKFYA